MKRFPFAIFILLLLHLMIGCCESPVSKVLDVAESVMMESPDSALSIIESVEADGIDSDDIRARLHYLKTWAKDKKHQDISCDTCIDFSVAHYRKHNDSHRSMMSYYCQGRVEYARANYSKALFSFSQAHELAKILGDQYWIGMTAQNIADIYCDTYNHKEALTYAKAEYQHTLASGIQPFVNYSIEDLARAYYNNLIGDTAIIYANQAIDSAIVCNDNILLREAMRTKACSLYILHRDQEAVCVFEQLSDKGLSNNYDSIFLVFSLINLNQLSRASDILDKMSKADTLRYVAAKASLFKAKNQMDSSAYYQNIFDKLDAAALLKSINQNLYHGYTDSFSSVKERSERQMREARLINWIIFLVAFIAVGGALVVVFWIRNRHKAEIIEYDSLIDDLKDLLSKNELLLAEKDSSLSHKEQIISQKDEDLVKKTDITKSLIARQYDWLAEISNLVTKLEKTQREDGKIIGSLSNVIKNFNFDKEKRSQLQNYANELYGNVFDNFSQDFADLPRIDKDLYLLSVLKVPASIISIFLHQDRINQVYERKKRLKSKMEKLNPEKARFYIDFI